MFYILFLKFYILLVIAIGLFIYTILSTKDYLKNQNFQVQSHVKRGKNHKYTFHKQTYVMMKLVPGRPRRMFGLIASMRTVHERHVVTTMHWKNRVLSRSWKFRLQTNFHTMEVSKRLEVDFQQISIPWKCPKGWKYHGNLLEVAMISMNWRGHGFSSDAALAFQNYMRCTILI